MSNQNNQNNEPGFFASIYDALDDFFYSTRRGKIIYKFLAFAMSVLSIWLGIWLTSKNNDYQGKLEVIHMINQLVAFQTEGIEKNSSQYENYSHDEYRIMTDSVSLDVYEEVISDQKVRNYLDATAYANIYHILEMAEYAEGYLYSEHATDEGKIKSIKTRDYLASEINELLLTSVAALENKTDHDTLVSEIETIKKKYANDKMDFIKY